MNQRMAVRLASSVAFAFGCATLAGGALAQQVAPMPKRALSPVETVQQKAKEASEFEFLGALARTCFLPPSRSEDLRDIPAPYVTDPSKAPPRSSWYAEPAKVFDNLYFVGGKIHSAWALTTREGIILFDTIYPYNSEELIVGGMKKLGLDPKDIKYLIISHAHQDHIGGAEMMQKQFKPRLVMSGPDWDLVEKLAGRGNGPHPYEIGADWVARYFQVTENCARATQIKLEQLPR
ncbi:MAG: MBL fold metallo-hydrolase [Betaproteobacteria bacterium]|nr:MBL fold metallo-hydrolase [Betaproteobacteria bacterium]